MPRKPTLSPSKITTYLACPDKYKWTYVDDRGKWYLRSKSYYSFGSTLHGVLQRFHDSGDTGVTTTHQAVAALEESWIDAGYTSQEEMMQAMAEGKAIVESYIENFRAQPVTAETIYIEKMLRRDLGPFVLIGRVDRVDQHKDGTIEIVDYKSGRQTVAAEDVSTDLAMNCYALLLQEKHADANLCASIFALRSNTKATHAFDATELEVFTKDLITLGVDILERDYASMTPVFKDLCPHCDFLPLCKKHPDFVSSE